MPVEIRELVIRASTNLDDPEYRNRNNQNPAVAAIDQDALIQECVQQVMKILQKKKDR